MKVSFVGTITNLIDVEKSDFLSQATVVCGKGGKWTGVVKRGELNVGALVEVYLPDAILPEVERFSFLKNKRIKQCRLRGAISEVLIVPLSSEIMASNRNIGDSIDDIVGVVKYEKPIDASIGGDTLGNFPAFIPKTDEPNFQTVSHMIEALYDKMFYASVKMDGSSGTVYRYQGHFGVCSRNQELKESEHCMGWVLAKKYNLLEILPEGIAIQFEMMGSKIQGNPMGIEGNDIAVFNAYDILQRKYYDFEELKSLCETLKVPMVQVSEIGCFGRHHTENVLRMMAEGKYQNGKPREGIVIRPLKEMMVNGERLSFKVINLNYGR